MEEKEFRELIDWLRSQSCEKEWLEFKQGYHGPDEMGQDISALSNSANLEQNDFGYLVYGIKDKTHDVIGMESRIGLEKVGNQDIQDWMMTKMLSPRIDFRVYEYEYNGKLVSLVKIPASTNEPVKFKKISYVRVHNSTRPLGDYPAKEGKIWNSLRNVQPFEELLATEEDYYTAVFRLLDIDTFYELADEPKPTTTELLLSRLEMERLIVRNDNKYAITNLGALVFGVSLKSFPALKRRGVRVLKYLTNNRSKIDREQVGDKGYAVGMRGLIDFIENLIPYNEVVEKGIRTQVKMYPKIAIREIVANAMFHQDFYALGTGPLIEIFSDRIEFSNTGLPLLPPDRFIDSNLSRNPIISETLKRMHICEELGRGWDMIVDAVEIMQLPAPVIIKNETQTRVILFAHKDFGSMDRSERIRACYQHACLKMVIQQRMNNQSLRDRFGLDENSAGVISKVISDTMKEGLIKPYDPTNKSYRYNTYIPNWASSVE